MRRSRQRGLRRARDYYIAFRDFQADGNEHCAGLGHAPGKGRGRRHLESAMRVHESGIPHRSKDMALRPKGQPLAATEGGQKIGAAPGRVATAKMQPSADLGKPDGGRFDEGAHARPLTRTRDVRSTRNYRRTYPPQAD